MHISETRQTSNTILTKCSKMTEEKHKRHGMNGTTAADGVVKEEALKSGYVQGGRLKFFKDGKFILELERAREGERVSWVSVPRKTFWPPRATAASTPTYRQESSTSLSVSDDNSSIQSSPWQRDHSWKQLTPRRNQSTELSFYFWRPKYKRLLIKSRKSHHPHSTASKLVEFCETSSERTVKKTSSVCSINKMHRVRPSLLSIVQTLSDRTTTSIRATVDVVVSPRKRFLREMEKDKIQVEDGSQKRSRNKTPLATVVAAASPSQIKVRSPVSVNGSMPSTITVVEEIKPTRNCSYSITSLLAEDRNIKRSPSNSPSHFNTVTQPQYCSPSAEDRWYTESVDRLRSIELSQADKRAYPSYPPPYLPHYMYPYSLPSYYGPNVYGRGYILPPVYHHAPPIPIPTRQETPSCSWTVEPTLDSDRKDENSTDMPLNLSKHAG